jgi:hypothetical protein
MSVTRQSAARPSFFIRSSLFMDSSLHKKAEVQADTFCLMERSIYSARIRRRPVGFVYEFFSQENLTGNCE